MIISFFFSSCSVACFKIHKCEDKLNATDQFVIDTTPDKVENPEDISYLLEIPDEYIVPTPKLELLKESPELEQLLENHHLRDFLKFAHETYNPSGFMKLAMREPLFVEFADACLKVIHPEKYPKKEPTDQEIIDHIQESIENAD